MTSREFKNKWSKYNIRNFKVKQKMAKVPKMYIYQFTINNVTIKNSIEAPSRNEAYDQLDQILMNSYNKIKQQIES